MLSIVAACSMAPAFAQKGNLLYYGSLGGSVQSGGGPRFASMFVNSGLGYQFNDHFTLGVTGGFSDFRVKEQGVDEVENSAYGVGAFGRYTSYLGDRFFIFAQANASYLSGNAQPRSGKEIALNVFPGIGLNVGRNWALNLNIYAFTVRTQFEGGTSAGFNMGQGYSFGVSKGFGRKRTTPSLEK
jgi:hypothetical protein